MIQNNYDTVFFVCLFKATDLGIIFLENIYLIKNTV